MSVDFDSADASYYYRETAAADVARFDTAAVLANLADVMKNATILLPDLEGLKVREEARERTA